MYLFLNAFNLAYSLSLRNLEEIMADLNAAYARYWDSNRFLASIELIHIIRKGQYQPTKNEGLSPAEQFYLLAA